MSILSTFERYTQESSKVRLANTRLFPAEAESLLRNLVKSGWWRLSSEYHDPLGMLFGNRAKQWTAGWDIETHSFLLLIWETDSWQEKPVWSFYRDGQLIFQEEDGFSKTRSHLLHQLLESESLPFINESALLEPLTDFRHDALFRKQAAVSLMAGIRARPEIFDLLKEPLLAALESDLDSEEWPTLEILKLHRVGHKVILVDLIRQCMEMGLLRTQEEAKRVERALRQLQAAFVILSRNISGLFLPKLRAAHMDFRTILTQGNWRIRLHTMTQGASGNERPLATAAQG